MQNQTTTPKQNDASVAASAVRAGRTLSWYDHVWSALPLMLLYTGGTFGLAGNLLGGLVGAAGAYLNLRIMRGPRGAALRYLLSFLVILGALVVFAILITLYQAFTHQL